MVSFRPKRPLRRTGIITCPWNTAAVSYATQFTIDSIVSHTMWYIHLVVVVYLTVIIMAYPGMMGDLIGEIQRRQDNATEDEQFDSRELIGDLLNLTDAQLTPVGRSIKNIITQGGNDTAEGESPQSDVTWDGPVPAKDTPECVANVCCIWQYISNDLQQVFRGNSGRCTKLARGAIRLGFHVSGQEEAQVSKHY